MCLSCMDADKKAIMLQNKDNCIEEGEFTITFDELKCNLTQEWLETNKTNYRIFKKNVSNSPSNHIDWIGVNSDTNRKSTISVDFV